jgi:hypothetical protein
LYLHRRLRPLRPLRLLLLKRLTQHPTHSHKHRLNSRHLHLYLPRPANPLNPVRRQPLLSIPRAQIKALPPQVINSNTFSNTIRSEHSTEPIQSHGPTNSKDLLRSGPTIANLCTLAAGLGVSVKILQPVQESIPFRTWWAIGLARSRATILRTPYRRTLLKYVCVFGRFSY